MCILYEYEKSMLEIPSFHVCMNEWSFLIKWREEQKKNALMNIRREMKKTYDERKEKNGYV